MSPVDFFKIGYQAFQHAKGELLDENIAARNVIVRPDDVWLVSYPKSGNTWTRFLLANLIYKSSQVGFNNIERLIPDIYQHSNYSMQSRCSRRYLKSHEYFDPRYKKVILIVRDPRDIAVSYYHHMIKFGQLQEEADVDQFIDQFIGGDLNPFGSWGENVGSWLGTRGGNQQMLLLRYEDMLDDTGLAVRKIACFLGEEVTDGDVEMIVKYCSVDAMQTLERKQGAYWKPLNNSNKDKLFVRNGKYGEWRTLLTSNQARVITSSWRHQFEELGYSCD